MPSSLVGIPPWNNRVPLALRILSIRHRDVADEDEKIVNALPVAGERQNYVFDVAKALMRTDIRRVRH